jgi:phosphotransferase system  glucose/maltose/N-acetylglucosamine-specific IIC component
MGNFEMIGRWLVAGGILIAVLGGILWALGRFAGLNRLPGTLRIEGSGFTCVIPILASIVLSLVLTVVLNLLARFLNR